MLQCNAPLTQISGGWAVFHKADKRRGFFAGWLITMATSRVASPCLAALISEIRENFCWVCTSLVAAQTILKEELKGNSINQRAPQSQTSGCSSYIWCRYRCWAITRRWQGSRRGFSSLYGDGKQLAFDTSQSLVMYSVQKQGEFAAAPFQSGEGQRKWEAELGERCVSWVARSFFPFRAR